MNKPSASEQFCDTISLSDPTDVMGSNALKLTGSEPGFVVIRGKVWIFATTTDGVGAGRRIPLASAGAGDIVIPVQDPAKDVVLTAVGELDTQVRKFDYANIEPALAQLDDGTVKELLNGIAASWRDSETQNESHSIGDLEQLEALLQDRVKSVAAAEKQAAQVKAQAVDRNRRDTRTLALRTREGLASAILWRQRPTVSAAESHASPTWAAVSHVRIQQRREPPKWDPELPDDRHSVDIMMKRLGGFAREILLPDEWWKHDHGSFLAYTTDGAPVAVVRARRHYRLWDPTTEQSSRVDAKLAASISQEAWMLYDGLPAGELGIRDLFRFVMRDTRTFWLEVVITGLLSGLLSLTLPLATNLVFGTVVPSGNISWLVYLGIFVAAAIIAAVGLRLARSLIRTRMGAWWSHDMDAAVWYRLVHLPGSFYRQYTVGDLEKRAQTFQRLISLFSGPILGLLLTTIFSSFSLVLLLVFDWRLGLIALAGTVVQLTLLIFLVLRSVHYARILLPMSAEVSNREFEVIRAITKIRTSGAEVGAFSFWGEEFAAVTRLGVKLRKLDMYMSVSSKVIPSITSIIILWVVGSNVGQPGVIAPATFVAFLSALGQFTGTMTNFADVAGALAVIRPMFERVLPIVSTQPESRPTATGPTSISGHIELRTVDYRYEPDTDLVLDNLSMTIEPGKFVALTGHSGAGKTTIARLLLGLERPESGLILYDDREMGFLNLSRLRQHIGTVLQNMLPEPGSIFDNVTAGNRDITEAQVFEALDTVGFGDLVRQLPMGLHTVVGHGAGTFSGGQIQQMQLAGILISRPPVVILDEATSALDNVAQKRVTDALAEMKCTRIVIAHRLSTVRHADEINVLNGGRIQEHGTYDELLAQNGIFADLIRRQQNSAPA